MTTFFFHPLFEVCRLINDEYDTCVTQINTNYITTKPYSSIVIMTKQQDLWWDCPAPLDSNLHKVQVFWATHQYQEARRIVDEDQAGDKTIPEACVDDVRLVLMFL